MKVPEKFLDGQELDVQDLGPVDGLWMFVPNQLLRDAVNQGRQGMMQLDSELRQVMKYSGDTTVVLSVPLMKYTQTRGWPPVGFAVAVIEGTDGIYIQPQDKLPDPSTRIAEA